MDPQSIRETFNSQLESNQKEWDGYGLTGALEQLSEAVANLKAAGLDVSLEMSPWPSEMAFMLFPDGARIVPVTGDLRIGNSHRLLGIATKLGSDATLMLAVSEFDSLWNGANATLQDGGDIRSRFRALRYDLKNDAEALEKFQRTIIRDCARSALMEKHNIARGYETGQVPVLPKPALKIPPQQKP